MHSLLAAYLTDPSFHEMPPEEDQVHIGSYIFKGSCMITYTQYSLASHQAALTWEPREGYVLHTDLEAVSVDGEIRYSEGPEHLVERNGKQLLSAAIGRCQGNQKQHECGCAQPALRGPVGHRWPERGP